MNHTKSLAKKLFRFLAWVFGVFFLLAMLLFTRVDWRNYQDLEYYSETMENFQDLAVENSEGKAMFVGWSSTNVTPESAATIVGYKPRGEYEYVQDSSYIKTLVVGNGISTVAFLNYELLIVHPYLVERIENAINREKLPIDFIYFTATHTHTGMGGYIPGPMGKIAFGGCDENIVALLERRTIEGIQSALSDRDTAEISFKKIKAETLVTNRFIPDDPIDPYIRQLIFEKKNGEIGTFLTYSAHPTTLSSKFMGLSGDYPFYLTQALEENGFDFALFAAGTVGSHRPVTEGNRIEHTKGYALTLQDHIIQGDAEKNIPGFREGNLITAKVQILLRTAHYRITDNIRLRPWVFNWLFGDPQAHFDMVIIGNTLLLSSSGEISGVFMEQWETLANAQGLNLMITCFNGGYIGYITPDEYYNYHYHEVREMNLYGPYNGSYFDEMIRKLIMKEH